MRLSRYLDTAGALLTIEHKALKLSRLHELNDPFEGRIGISNLIDGVEHLAEAGIEAALREISSGIGVICFSAVSDEPVLWAHYADRHRGMVLEFEVPDDPAKVVQMSYTDERPHVDARRIGESDHIKAQVLQLIRQKSNGWSYEQEYRLYEHLAECEARGGHYYKSLDQLTLKRVIVGWRCNTDVQYVQRALSDAGYSDVPVIRAAAKSDSYKISC